MPSGADFLAVVVVAYFGSDYLICFVAFARYEYYVARMCQCRSRAYGLASVGDGQGAGGLCGVESCRHVVEYGLWILGARIVGCEHKAGGAACGLGGHDGALAAVAVAAAAYDGYYLCSASGDFVNGVEHVDEGVGGVGIVDNGCHSFGRAEWLETSCHRMEAADGGSTSSGW